jgi:hypothetical protein
MPEEYVLRLEASGEVTRAQPEAEDTNDAEAEPEEADQ